MGKVKVGVGRINITVDILANKVLYDENNQLAIKVNCQSPHSATLSLNGYKHSMVLYVSYAIALNQKMIIQNPPLVEDTYVFCDIINELGGEAYIDKGKFVIDPTNIHVSQIPRNLSKLIHGSVYLMPALVMRLGKFTFYEAGGCRIGGAKENEERSIHHLIDIMKRFGVIITTDGDCISGMRSADIIIPKIDILRYSTQTEYLAGPLVGGAVKAAVLMSLFQDSIEIQNPYLKTDILDLLCLVQKSGRLVSFDSDRIIIKNRAKASSDYLSISLTQCISEIVTYSALAIINNVQVRFIGLDRTIVAKGLQAEFELFDKMNIQYKWDKNDLIIYDNQQIKSQDIIVTPHGIQSDHQAFFALLLLYGDKRSTIYEQVYTERFFYLNNFIQLGAKITRQDNSIHIVPSTFSSGSKELFGHDVRTAAATLIACTASRQECILYDCNHLLRGYDALQEKFEAFGIELDFWMVNNNAGFIDT